MVGEKWTAVVVTEHAVFKETVRDHADVMSNEDAVGMLSSSPPFPQSLTSPIMFFTLHWHT